MARPWRRASIVTAVGLMILLAAMVLGRSWMAEQVIQMALVSQGFGPAQVNVTGFGPDGIAIAGLDAGGHVRAETITVVRHGWRIVNWDIRVRKLKIAARYDEDGLTLGGLKGLSPNSGSTGSAAMALPRITIMDAAGEIATPDGLASLSLIGSLQAGGTDGLIQATGTVNFNSPRVRAFGWIKTTATQGGTASIDADLLSLSAKTPNRPFVLQNLKVTGDLQPGFLDLDIDGYFPGLSARLALNAVVAAPFDNPFIDVGGFIEIKDPGALGIYLPALPPTLVRSIPEDAGVIRLGWRADGVLDLDGLLSPETAATAFEGAFAFQTSGEIDEIAGLAKDVTFNLDAEGQIDGGVVTVELSDTSLETTHPGTGLLALKPDPGGRIRRVGRRLKASTGDGSRMKIALTGTAIQPLSAVMPNIRLEADALNLFGNNYRRIRLSGDARLDEEKSHFDGTLEAAADSWLRDGLELSELHVWLPIEAWGSKTVTQAVVLDGVVTARTIKHVSGALVTLGRAPKLGIRAYSGPCTVSGCTTGLENLSLSLKADSIGFATPQTGPVGLTTVGATAILRKLDQPEPALVEIDVRAGRASSKEYASAEGLSIRGTLRSDLDALDLKVSAHRVQPIFSSGPGIPAVEFSGSLQGSMDDPAFQGTVAPVGSSLPSIRITADRQTVQATWDKASLAELIELEAVTAWLPERSGAAKGTLSLSAFHTINTGVTRLELDLTDAGAETGIGVFSGLNSRMRLISLDPPVSAGPQTLTVDRVEAGTTLSNLAVRFDIGDVDGATKFHIRELQGDLFGGRMRFDPVTLDGSGAVPELMLRVDSLSLQELTALAGLEDFAMEGSVSGIIPFAIDPDNRVAIREGVLSADSPGVMRLNLDSLKGTLSQQMGAQADLLLNALRNFRYSKLEARISKPFDANEDTEIRLEGQNPDHLEGQPFIFNINVNSNVIRLADTIFGLYRATLGEVQALARKAQNRK